MHQSLQPLAIWQHRYTKFGRMKAIPPDFGLPSGNTGSSPHGPLAPALDQQWAVLRNAGHAIAAMIAPADRPELAEPLDFPQALNAATGWRKVMIEQGLSDLIAMMEPGLSALLEVHARGHDASAPALALWQEFSAARSALVALAPLSDDDMSSSRTH